MKGQLMFASFVGTGTLVFYMMATLNILLEIQNIENEFEIERESFKVSLPHTRFHQAINW